MREKRTVNRLPVVWKVTFKQFIDIEHTKINFLRFSSMINSKEKIESVQFISHSVSELWAHLQHMLKYIIAFVPYAKIHFITNEMFLSRYSKSTGTANNSWKEIRQRFLWIIRILLCIAFTFLVPRGLYVCSLNVWKSTARESLCHQKEILSDRIAVSGTKIEKLLPSLACLIFSPKCFLHINYNFIESS